MKYGLGETIPSSFLNPPILKPITLLTAPLLEIVALIIVVPCLLDLIIGS